MCINTNNTITDIDIKIKNLVLGTNKWAKEV